MPDAPTKDAPKRPRAAKTKAAKQASLPLLDPVDEAVTTPQKAAAAPLAAPVPKPIPASLADRAARYNRHRSPLDDRPLTQQTPGTVAQTERPLPSARPHLRTNEQPQSRPAAAPPPLDMAAIAARNRQVRDVARDVRPAPAAPVPPPRRTTLERDAEAPVRTPPPVSMLDRAARHNALLRERDDLPAQKPQKQVIQRAKQAPESAAPAMVERAADATRRRRDKLGGAIAQEVPADVGIQPIHLPSTAFVLISRNDGGRVQARIQGWRAVLQATDVRWWLLDLGSVDESVTAAQALHAQVLEVPGGLVEPLRTLDTLLKRVDADVVVLADADAYPDGTAVDLLTQVRGGAALAVADRLSPSLVVISREAVQNRPLTAHLDLSGWSGQELPGQTPLLVEAPGFLGRLLHAPVIARAWRRLDPIVRQVQRLATHRPRKLPGVPASR